MSVDNRDEKFDIKTYVEGLAKKRGVTVAKYLELVANDIKIKRQEIKPQYTAGANSETESVLY